MVFSGGQRIWLVDDNHFTRESWTLVLNNRGYCATAFSVPTEVTECIKDGVPYDLLVVDYVLGPEQGRTAFRHDAIDIAKLSKEVNPSVPVLLSSGYGVGEIESIIRRSNGVFDGYIQKPLFPDDYIRIMETALRHSCI
ncbi:MAG: response regulator [Candidatus Woesearchaeota archaeon]